jgi:putative FmdB family regulatory protein
MPIYEYRCQTCKREFEYLVMGSAKPECPHCDSKKVCRLMSTCGFLSKGSGGETVKTAASTSACSGCSATSCSSCGH